VGGAETLDESLYRGGRRCTDLTRSSGNTVFCTYVDEDEVFTIKADFCYRGTLLTLGIMILLCPRMSCFIPSKVLYELKGILEIGLHSI
jgi:hypothetical protein